jgi:pSer/pThr/pTyr-binding forkhead associated (FHA) protein
MSLNSFQLTLTSKTEIFSYESFKNVVIIGRSLNCDFNVLREELSREHCRVERIDDEILITDLKSKNGVMINELRIEPNVPVKINQRSVILVAGIFELRIDAVEINTELDQDFGDVTLELEAIPSHVVRAKKVHARKVQKKRPPPKEEKGNEALKMIIAFALVMGFIIYQAIGR